MQVKPIRVEYTARVIFEAEAEVALGSVGETPSGSPKGAARFVLFFFVFTRA